LDLPGIGLITVATVLAYLPVGIWGEVKAAAAYAGVHPCQVQSGTRQHSQMGKAGPAPLRRVLYMAALAALQWDADMRTRYERLLAAGKLPLVALGAIMHAVLRKMMGVLRRYYHEHPTRPATAAA
jgi:transposase